MRKNLINTNKKFENKFLTLTETKIFYQNKLLNFLKLYLIKENEKLMIKNSNKLQEEVSLLTKNKKILIEINDQYHEQINLLDIDKQKLIDEKLNLDGK